MEQTLRIGEVSKQSGLAPSAIRYYESLDIVPIPGRTESGWKVTDERVKTVISAHALEAELQYQLIESTDDAEKYGFHGIAHAHAAFGPERLTTILGTIALDFAASADTTPAASSGTPAKSDAGVTFE
jgi:hypothetical protein